MELIGFTSWHDEHYKFFGDFEDAELADKLYEKYGHELDATYIQLGHHGNNVLAPSYYLNLHPSAVYVDAPYF